MRASTTLHLALTAALLGTVAVGGCQCITETGLDQIPPEPDAGFPPPPPKFPLKVGDRVEIQPFGGRTDEDANGGSDFAAKATWDIKGVALNDDQRWEITADVLYEKSGTPTITAAAISRLALENVADFPALETNASVVAEGAVFTTDHAPALDSSFKPNNFPFFQGDVDGNDADEGDVFNAAAADFRETILALDEEAEIDTQIAVGRFEAYFRDALNGPPMLHHLKATVHPMGLICEWDEALVPFTEGMARNQASLAAAGVPPLAAIQPVAISVTRDNVRYFCDCFSGVCRQGTDCLDPKDPDAEPSECPQ